MPGWIKTLEGTVVNDYYITTIIRRRHPDGTWLVIGFMEGFTDDEILFYEGTKEECENWLKPFSPYEGPRPTSQKGNEK